MMLFVIICVIVLSSFARPRHYFRGYYDPMFGYGRHRPMHMGPRPMGGPCRMHRPMGNHPHMGGRGPMGGFGRH